MKAKFWDVKTRKSVETEVLECVTYENGRSAYKAKTADGRNLTRFVSKEEAAKFNGGKCACKGKKK